MNNIIVRIVLVLLGWSAFVSDPAGAATDPRFFGIYCGQQERFEECVQYRRCLGRLCGRLRTHCEAFEVDDIRLRVAYREPATDFGVVSGRGTANVESERLYFDFSGTVTAPGVVHGRATSNLFGPNSSMVRLSEDGLALTVSSHGQTMTVRKDLCGNPPPAVNIVTPSDGIILGFGESHNFRATVHDDQETFPREQMVFHSDRDGLLGYGKIGPREASLWIDTLSPGDHVVTFTATDDGGLRGSAEIHISVTNRPPETPNIMHPQQPPDTLVATGAINFEGRSYDPESGPLDGTALIWELSPDGSRFEHFGNGQRFTKSIIEPGDYILRLTANDPNGAVSSTEEMITVLPFTGNTPPRVRITGVRDLHGWFVTEPSALRGQGIAVSPGETLVFSATAEDLEDHGDELSLEWKAQIINPPGETVVFGDGPEAEITLEGSDDVTAEVIITFRAVDGGGLENSSTLTFYILPVPLI